MSNANCPERSVPGAKTLARKPRRRWRDLRRSTQFCLLATWMLLLLVGVEMAARGFWTFGKKLPVFGTRHIWRTFFPEVAESHAEEAPRDHHDATFHVLILGPSVWHRDYGGDMAKQFEKGLAEMLGRPVRVYNASYPGRTSRDALVIYRHLADQRFDLVLVYHGINDAFLNNCSASVFRNDYSHASRYKNLRLLDRHPEHSWLAFPFTVHYHLNRLLKEMRLGDEADLKYREEGNDVKTPPAFRANLEEILVLARQRGDRVLLTTLAYHLPAGYSKEAFLAHKLDYAQNRCPVEMWGPAGGVTRAVNAHNAIVRELAAHSPDAFFVDLARLMPAGKAYYDDPCHLTPAGCKTMVALLLHNLDRKALLAQCSAKWEQAHLLAGK